MRRVHPGMSPFRAGLIAIAVILVATYFGFTKRVPLQHHYTVQAVFKTSNLIKKGSPVRIAGVDVGKVTGVGRYKDTDYGLVTMTVDDAGRPVHRDATLKIRPRLFLEGNFYVDLQPGTPDTAELPDGELIPVSRTATPVQIDQVLTALQADTRANLQKALQGLGDAFNSEPTAADDASQDPAVRGLTGGQAINETLTTSPQALGGTALVTDALLGTAPHDLSATIKGFARAATSLSRREGDLRDLVSEFDATMGNFAAHASQLTQSVRELGPAATHARGAFANLSAAIPPTRAFARDLAGSVPELPATIEAAGPWLDQAQALLGDDELGGLLKALAPATGNLAALGHATREWLPRIDAFNRCITGTIIPTGNVKVEDGELSTGVENYKEFWYAMVGQNGEGQVFDGNGSLLRLAAAGGATTLQTGRTNYSDESLFGNTALPPLRTRPAYPNRLPPIRRDVPCASSGVPDVNGPASTGPADGSRAGAPAPALPEDPKP
jgi:phospholipid/cholesterol/gamma-HCH transport system substrate-binding protein